MKQKEVRRLVQETMVSWVERFLIGRIETLEAKVRELQEEKKEAGEQPAPRSET